MKFNEVTDCLETRVGLASLLGMGGYRKVFREMGGLLSPEECRGVKQVKGTWRETSWPGGRGRGVWRTAGSGEGISTKCGGSWSGSESSWEWEGQPLACLSLLVQKWKGLEIAPSKTPLTGRRGS